MNNLFHSFMTHLHLYEAVAVALIVAAVAFLIFLSVRYTKPYRGPNKRKPAPRRG